MTKAYSEYSDLTARHWAVVGSMRFGPRPPTPTAIALDLGFDVAEVVRLLADLEQANVLHPIRES